jgi:aspartyl-tRNA(Asn)/glutamyl-tRNA(Gln) amidotransferase subunit A
MTELCYASAVELGRRLRCRELSPVELTQALLDRVDRYDLRIHAFVTVTGEHALAQARIAEAEISAGIDRGPLHGIPFGLKDIIATAGIRTTAHSKLLADNIPEADARVVELMYQGGATLLGKLATYEFALGGLSHDLPWPPARNPWNLARLPGGSSSGAGAAVAAGFLPLAIGTDTGGSIRWPAAVCGLVGLKPTYGLISRRGVQPNTFSMDHCGPISRTVEDCALLLQALAGYDAHDPGSIAGPIPDYRAAFGGDLRGLKIGLVDNWYAGADVHPELTLAMSRAIATLSDLGAVVEQVVLPDLQVFGDCKTMISTAELYAIHEPDLKTRPDDFGMVLRNRVLPGALLRAEDYVQAQRLRLELCGRLGAALGRHDVLVTAGWLGPAEPAIARPLGGMASLITAPFSVGGLPAIVLPCGVTTEGLPLSLQIAGRPFDEQTVLRVAHAYEQATEWHKRHPDLDSLREPMLLDELPHGGPPQLTNLPEYAREELRTLLARAGLTLSEQHLTEFAEIFPHYAAAAARLPRGRSRSDELAHLFNPVRACAT